MIDDKTMFHHFLLHIKTYQWANHIFGCLELIFLFGSDEQNRPSVLLQLVPRHALLGRHGAVDPHGRLLRCGQEPRDPRAPKWL